MLIPPEFYSAHDVVDIARLLLGKLLVTEIDGHRSSGIITETEAYAGVTDKASHAWGGRRTKRTEVMYMQGGTAYVYLCYGIHHLFNVVTHEEGTPHAVLIRAIEPVDGLDIMLQRRKMSKLTPALTAGPGALSQALGINTAMTGLSLFGNSVYIEERPVIPDTNIVAATRIGVNYAGDDALLPYRFYIKGNKYVSKGKGL